MSENKFKRKWQKRAVASVGLDKGETYYLNIDTGDTQWDRPEDYFSEDELELQEIERIIAFDKTKPLDEILSMLKITTEDIERDRNIVLPNIVDDLFDDDEENQEENKGDDEVEKKEEAEEEKEKRKNLSETWESVGHKVKQLNLCFENAGSAEEWQQKLMENNFELPKIIYSFFEANVGEQDNIHYSKLKLHEIPDDVRLNVAKFMVIFTDLAETSAMKKDYYSKLVSSIWGVKLNLFLRHCELGIASELLKINNDSSEKNYVYFWLRLLYGVLTYGDYDLSSTANKEKTERSLPESCKFDEEFIKNILKVMTTCGESEFLAACQVYFSICCHYALHKYTNDEIDSVRSLQPSEIIVKTFLAAKSNVTETPSSNPLQNLSEGLIYLLNSQHYPYKNKKLLSQILHTIKLFLQTDTAKYMELNLTQDIGDIFRPNDINVIIDMILLEVADLPVDDNFRVTYLEILFMIIKNSKWKSSGKARRPEIMVCLDNVMNAQKSGMLPQASKYAMQVLLRCANELV